MEQTQSIPFSTLIASLLLCKRQITSVEVVNAISRLCCEGIDICDDDYDCLSSCVIVDNNYCFSLKMELDYDSFIFSNVRVKEFLLEKADFKLLTYLGYECNVSFSDNSVENIEDKTKEVVMVKARKRNKKLIPRPIGVFFELY